MSKPHACLECLRRAHLLTLLGPYFERLARRERGNLWLEHLRVPNELLAQIVAPDVGEQLLARVAALTEEHLTEDLAEAACWATCIHDDLYPAQLRETPLPPAALIGRGDPAHLRRLTSHDTVTIVGTTVATPDGHTFTQQLTYDLAAAEKVVLSGLGFGIEASAHRGALDAEGLTFAVLPCGADVAYPEPNRAQWQRICDHGLILSEFAPGTPRGRWADVARARLLAALAGITVVVEAEVRSAALTTADLADELGRKLGAVRGLAAEAVSAGPGVLLDRGALEIRSATDIVRALAPAKAAPEDLFPVCPGCTSEDLADEGAGWRCRNCGNQFDSPLWAES